ncbi:hypothetical protein Pcinc_021672 [Petrolisthes cinctipes]|uniref:Ribosomal protein L15 n=1 Tax=Petrolisthes cinctipes TaxID=88211 RepID=A0AAE1FHI5_PETCI|nr:hypothetical protein Pcinc_021672 [Petrolisthes cinctipes]
MTTSLPVPSISSVTFGASGPCDQSLAQECVGRCLGELLMLNSYCVAQDSTYKCYEVITVDIRHNAIRRDASINWMCNSTHKHRELRGKTSTGHKHLGLGKGILFKNTKIVVVPQVPSQLVCCVVGVTVARTFPRIHYQDDTTITKNNNTSNGRTMMVCVKDCMDIWCPESMSPGLCSWTQR